jgi:hypothetical protein
LKGWNDGVCWSVLKQATVDFDAANTELKENGGLHDHKKHDTKADAQWTVKLAQEIIIEFFSVRDS